MSRRHAVYQQSNIVPKSTINHNGRVPQETRRAPVRGADGGERCENEFRRDRVSEMARLKKETPLGVSGSEWVVASVGVGTTNDTVATWLGGRRAAELLRHLGRNASAMKHFCLVVAAILAACTSAPPAPSQPSGSVAETSQDYKIGPLDTVQVFVRNEPDLSVTVPVRPDGRISTPLIDDMPAAGKTASQLGKDIAEKLRSYVQDPVVTVMVSSFAGPFDQQVRVVGEATKPQAIPYRANMTVLDVMIEAGGLTEFADGNRAVLVRRVNGVEQSYSVRLGDLLKDGDIRANVAVMPGDVIMVPQSWF